MVDRPDTCVLQHKVFSLFADPLFRRAETDDAPVMVVQMGEREVAMPLRSLAREFALDEQSPDGQMLALIAEALDFVGALRPGDRLPSEILTGAASWEPSPEHVRIAAARLQLQLLEWLRAGRHTGEAPLALTAEELARGEVSAAARQAIQDALALAAQALGLPDADAVLRKVEDLAGELAFIEALRDRLLRRVEAMVLKLERLALVRLGDATQAETLNRVRQFAHAALRQFRERFEEQDAQIGEVMSALRHIEGHRDFIRGNRDWLYRTQRAWDPILGTWDTAEPVLDEAMRLLLSRTYHFLAPRYMPTTEWVSTLRPEKQPSVRGMVW